ncbi:outer membrane protein transport protein [Myxococcota bacterium]|nr:outer membrane protein transport protein [Myxococcota bacterium]
MTTPKLQRFLLNNILVLAILFVGAHAQAAGFWNMNRGVSNMGRGGANIAAPTDPTAVYTNPSALAGQRGLSFMLDANLYLDNRYFQRANDDLDGNGTETSYDAVSNSDIGLPSPGIFATYNFKSQGIEALTIAAAVYGPPRSDTVWADDATGEVADDGAQRYSQMESRNLQIHYALSAGYELPFYGIRLGVTGMLIDQIIDQKLRLWGGFNLTPSLEDEDWDVEVDIDATDKMIPTGIFAISAEPVKGVILAFSYQLPYDVRSKGTADITMMDDADQLADITGDQIELDLNMASILRAAIQYRDSEDQFNVELAWVYEGWGRLNKVAFRPVDIKMQPIIGAEKTLSAFDLETKWHDTSSLRLGGEFRILPDFLTIRAGAFWEQSAADAAHTDAFSFDLDKVGGSLGTRLDISKTLWIDVAGSYIHWMEQDVDNSEMAIYNIMVDPAEKNWAIGNGTYRSSQIVILGAIGGSFDL